MGISADFISQIRTMLREDGYSETEITSALADAKIDENSSTITVEYENGKVDTFNKTTKVILEICG